MMDTVSNVLLIAGAAWMVLAAAGLVRFEDVFQRLHAATKAATLGLLLVLAGKAVQLSGGGAAKLALAGLFVFLTAPTGAHLISRAVTRWGLEDIRVDRVDELPPRPEKDRPTGP
jgi:multicomponent Na+:H+ antiporter subunit G